MPNAFAYIMLFLWPLVVLVLFRRLPFSVALIWSVLGGYLFLPEVASVNLPLIPTYDKVLVPSLSALIIGWITLRQQKYRPMRRGAQGAVSGAPDPSTRAAALQPDPSNAPLDRAATTGQPASLRRAPSAAARGSRPEAPDQSLEAEDRTPARQRGRWIANLLIMVLLASAVGTWATNPERISAGPRSIPAMGVYDIFATGLSSLVVLLPFFLGRRYLGTPQAHRVLLRTLIAGALIYSAFILIEVRLSPQINKWVYGFYSHSFAQHIRNGGYRPMGFVGHGLRLGIFISMSVLAAMALYRLREANKPMKWLMIAGWLLVALFLSKTLGAFMITLALIPVAALLNVRGRLLVGTMIAALVLSYPLLRSSGVLSTERLMTTVQSLNQTRLQSFEYRLRNEDILLERAKEKPVFGWGGWGRSRVYDPDTGRDLSVTDGIWVIEMGTRGWIGYLAVFGLLTLPVLALFLRQRQFGIEGATAGLVLVHSANLMDLLPNSSLTPVTWLIAGALLARYEMGPLAQNQSQDGSTIRRGAQNRAVPPPRGAQSLRSATGGSRRA